MGGGLIQLIAYGSQDIYLTGNPQITFFKSVYRRHTNFAIECIDLPFNNPANFDKKITCSISKSGDLIHKIYLQVTLPEITPSGGGAFNWVNNIGHRLIKDVSIEIGGVEIDKHYGEWLSIWNELSQSLDKEDGYNEMIGNTASLTSNPVGDLSPDNSDSDGLPQSQANSSVVPETTLFIPLQFWFCRNKGLALPISSLQYHDVKFHITFRKFDECCTITPATATNANPTATTSITPVSPSLVNASLYIDYIFLDEEEKQQFAQNQHEYLIEQLQYNDSVIHENTANKVNLSFNHPCKELIWTLHPNRNNIDLLDSLTDAKLVLNGADRFTKRIGKYFRLVQPYQHHTKIPKEPIYVYSFSLEPEQHQPSGSVNMSRIDKAELHIQVGNNTKFIKVYATNYNILRIFGGMAGLTYSN